MKILVFWVEAAAVSDHYGKNRAVIRQMVVMEQIVQQ